MPVSLQLGRNRWRLSGEHSVATTYFEEVLYDAEQAHFPLTYQWAQPGYYDLEARVKANPQSPWVTCIFSTSEARPTVATSVMMRQRMDTIVNVGSNEFGASVAFLPISLARTHRRLPLARLVTVTLRTNAIKALSFYTITMIVMRHGLLQKRLIFSILNIIGIGIGLASVFRLQAILMATAMVTF